MKPDQLRAIVAESFSVAQVIVKLGLVPAGGNYKTVKSKIAAYGISTAHFTGSAWNVGERFRKFGRTAPLASILIEGSPYNFTHGLRRRLISEGYKKHQCENCGLTNWQEQPIPLELHHANGINNDHRLENIQLLCPNCHAQTHTYRGRNQSKARVV
jgi:HNH endonuclease